MTLNCSGVSVGSTRIETLPSSSVSSRSLIWRDVTNWPSRPANGEVLTPKIIETVGSSIGDRRQSATGFSASAIVSPIMMSSMPARQMMSPAAASVDVDALQPSNAKSFVTVVRWIDAVELADGDRVADLDAAVEDAADGEPAEVVARVEVRDEHLQRRRRPMPRGGGMCSTMASNSGRRSCARRRPGRCVAVPARGVGVEDREVELVFGGVEVDEQVVDLVQHLLRPRVRRGRSC